MRVKYCGESIARLAIFRVFRGKNKKYDPPAPLCAFVLEPKVQVGTLAVNRVSQMNGHTRHNSYSFPGLIQVQETPSTPSNAAGNTGIV